MNKKLTSAQKIIGTANSLRNDGYYIVNKRKKGQQKIFTCSKCKKDFDLSDSVEYAAAVRMFRVRDGLCVGCHYKLTGNLVY